MNAPRGQFFSGAGFAMNQHCRVGRGNFLQQCLDPLHAAIVADHLG